MASAYDVTIKNPANKSAYKSFQRMNAGKCLLFWSVIYSIHFNNIAKTGLILGWSHEGKPTADFAFADQFLVPL
jgi:cytochrome b subunit of formate dehydrogenase